MWGSVAFGGFGRADHVRDHFRHDHRLSTTRFRLFHV
jgi:hypothetical protein